MTELVLASASRFRAGLLRGAGLEFETVVSGVDEDEVKLALEADGASAADVAETLAELKAVQVSHRRPGAIVIGADQMLECDGRRFDKPRTMEEAEEHIRAFSGKTHHLLTAVVVARGGQRLWHLMEPVEMVVRELSDEDIKLYMARVGQDALETVGAYNFEGVGANLFSEIKGDYFTILGLPLLPLLGFLREHGLSGLTEK